MLCILRYGGLTAIQYAPICIDASQKAMLISILTQPYPITALIPFKAP